MTKKEYDKITELLNKRKEYNDLIVGMIITKTCKISGITSNCSDGYAYNLDEKERNDLQDYFTKKLDDIDNELKELGYYD